MNEVRKPGIKLGGVFNDGDGNWQLRTTAPECIPISYHVQEN